MIHVLTVCCMESKLKKQYFDVVRNITIEVLYAEIFHGEFQKQQKGFKGSTAELHFAPINSWFLIIDHCSWS